MSPKDKVKLADDEVQKEYQSLLEKHLTTSSLSSEDQTKIDEAIKSAQTAVDKLKDYDWVETNMMDLQKRLDALSGNGKVETTKTDLSGLDGDYY